MGPTFEGFRIKTMWQPEAWQSFLANTISYRKHVDRKLITALNAFKRKMSEEMMM